MPFGCSVSQMAQLQREIRKCDALFIVHSIMYITLFNESIINTEGIFFFSINPMP